METQTAKKAKSVDFGLCYICQVNTGPSDYKNFVGKPTLASIDKIITIAAERCTYGESEWSSLNGHLQGTSAEDLLARGISYHKKCYKDLTNKTHIDRARARYEKGKRAGSATDIKVKKAGRPSSIGAPESMSTSQKHSRENPFDKYKCVICQESTGSELHDVSTKNMGAQLKKIGQETSDESLKVRLSSIVSSDDPLQAVAEDMKYHLQCLVKANRDTKKKQQPEEKNVSFSHVLSDLEIIEIVETELHNDTRDVVLNMNEIHEMYVNLLKANKFPVPDNPRYKVYLKQLILDNIPNIHFSRPPDKTKPEQVLSTKLKDYMISSAITGEDLKEDLKVLLRAAKILRKDIATSSTWKFKGSFTDYEPPPLLKTFCKHAIQGTKSVKSACREDCINQSASVLAQHFVASCKTDRQVSYETKNKDVSFRQHTETPLTVGLALDIHKHTRSKCLVEKLEQLHLAIPYRKVMEIETSMANAVLQQMHSNGEVCLPSWLIKDTFVWFALDNIDFLESTPSGMNTLHGTAIAMYQSATPDKSPMLPPA